jgi:hypothetical protein
MKRNFLNIDVTQKDINQGGRRDPWNCPIAHALSRRLKGAEVSVGYVEIRGDGRSYYCSWEIEQWMNDFDEGLPVKPARFTLEAFHATCERLEKRG